ncbi:MAG: glycosyltransferase [Candidatus Omnitrophota bacterium]|jgi:processive 1,2-diacylglycerol beta-glucosyltransferase
MSAKRVLLLYISEISGHRSAALAIERALKIAEPSTEILCLNAFRYTNPFSERIVNRIYSAVIQKTPAVWEFLYDNQKVIKRLDNFKKRINKHNSPKLKKIFDKFKPDIVVCSQAYPCGMAAGYKKIYGSSIPLVGILTDYVPHSFWLYDEVDYYIVPAPEVGERLQKKGVPAHKIKPLGIPIDPKFNEPVDKGKVLQKMNLLPGVKNILIMGGGQGLGPIKTIIDSLKKVKTDFQALVVTGINKKLYNSLSKSVRDYKKSFLVLGYVNNINELMSISDIIVSKPGGITTSEALAKRLPMVIIKPIPGQEENNTVYLTGKNAAVKLDDPREAGRVIEELLLNRDALARIRASAGAIGKPNSGMDIAKFVLKAAT